MVYEKKEFVLKDGNKVVFKIPEISDAEKLLNHIKLVASSTDFLTRTAEDFTNDVALEEKFIASRRKESCVYICAYSGDDIIGCCEMNFGILNKNKHRATIGIAIQKAYQNKGLGSLFFDEMIRIAKENNNIEQIELDGGVISNNELAKHLYTKKGFIKTGDIPRQLKLKDGTYLDGELMVLFLDK